MIKLKADIKLLKLYLKNTRNDVTKLRKINAELLETLKGTVELLGNKPYMCLDVVKRAEQVILKYGRNINE